MSVEMLRTSGPMVPDMASIWLVFPEARFFSSYFVVMQEVRSRGACAAGLGSLARSTMGIKHEQPCASRLADSRTVVSGSTWGLARGTELKHTARRRHQAL